MLAGRDLYLFKKLELVLVNFKHKREEQGVTVGPNVISAVSNALFYACAKAMDGQFPYLQMYKANLLKDFQLPFLDPTAKAAIGSSSTPPQDGGAAGKSLPKLMINVFNGGKESGSKVKFSRFYLIIDVNPVDLAKLAIEQEQQEEDGGPPAKPFDIHEAYIKFAQAVEKSVGATKQGLAAFRRGVDGAFFNAYDNPNECFKVIEDAITATGANSDQRKYLKIGINTDAQSWYLEDANKYEWDGPKVQYDEDQLIDFYDKLLNDHPLVEYIEDAFAPVHIQPYKKFVAKLRESKPNVMVGAGHPLMRTDLEVIREFTQLIQPDSEDEEE